MSHFKTFAWAILLVLSTTAQAADPNEIFMIRTTSKTPDAVSAAIKVYSEQHKWQYLGENQANKGQVRFVKICIPEVGQLLWPVGLQLSALLPCGNVGIYQKGTATEISVLHPRYMYMLYPHAATERASAVAQPLLTEMLDKITQ